MLVSLDFGPPFSLGRGTSFVLDLAILGFGVAALFAGLWFHVRRLRAAQARELAQLAAQGPLREGAHVVLEGFIESRIDTKPVRVQLDQRRAGASGNDWHDGRRRVTAIPFDLETAQGTVRIEPGEQPLVAAELDTQETLGTARIQRAAFEHGERIVVYGSLHRERHDFAGYRGGAAGWTLRSPARGRVLLADRALGTRYVARIEVVRKFLWLAIPTWLAFHAFCTSSFAIAAFTGTHTTTHVTDWDLAKPTMLHTETEDGLVLSTPLNARAAADLQGSSVTEVPLLRSPWRPACFVGGQGWTSGPAVIGAMLVTFLAVVVLRGRYRVATPWYDRAPRS